jgi:hypothetical protein
MNIIGLYVYAPTTFSFPANTQIEPIEGAPISGSEVTLQPGVYRLVTSAPPIATGGASESHYQVVKINTKGGLPDPPPLAPIQNYNLKQIADFFDGAGTASSI